MVYKSRLLEEKFEIKASGGSVEYIWYIIAALGAVVGTGVVLTVMSAALIVFHYWEPVNKLLAA